VTASNGYSCIDFVPVSVALEPRSYEIVIEAERAYTLAQFLAGRRAASIWRRANRPSRSPSYLNCTTRSSN
jgi:hypothetical protein